MRATITRPDPDVTVIMSYNEARLLLESIEEQGPTGIAFAQLVVALRGVLRNDTLT